MNNPLVRLFGSRIYIALILLPSLLAIGVLGFKFISNYTRVDLKLAPNSKVIVLGRPEQIQKLNSVYNIN